MTDVAQNTAVVAPVLAALLGNAAAFEVFKHLAGLATPAADGKAVVAQDSRAPAAQGKPVPEASLEQWNRSGAA
mgnify:CR=1 FL=1